MNLLYSASLPKKNSLNKPISEVVMIQRNFVVFTTSAFLFLIAFTASPLTASQKNSNTPSKTEIIQKTKKLQIPFIANNGQVNEKVKFYANTFGGTVFVTNDGEIVYSLPCGKNGELKVEGSEFRINGTHKGEKLGDKGQEDKNKKPDARNRKANFLTSNPSHETHDLQLKEHHPQSELYNPQSEIRNPKSETRGIALKESLVGGKISVIKGEEKAITNVNYFKGKDPSKWKANIATYDVVNLGEIYEGIELKLKAYGSNVEKLFYVKPGADPSQIKIKLSGGIESREEVKSQTTDFITSSPKLWINEHGELEVETALGPVKFTKPIAYQEIDDKKVYVPVEYSLLNQKLEYSFKIVGYDKTKEMIIDPLLASTFLGGSYGDPAYSIFVDKDGNVFVVGSAWSSDFPTTADSYDTSFNGGDEDIFVSKLSSDLTSLLASTYLGGSSSDMGRSIVTDLNENIYVVGTTESSDFPTTNGAYDTSYNSGRDVFVVKLNKNLTNLLVSTYLGGSSTDYSYSITSGQDGNIYVAGSTYSIDFPTTVSAYSIHGGGDYNDIFVTKLDQNLTYLLASTYLGGSSSDYNYSIAIDSNNSIYIGGLTKSVDFPTTPGVYDTSHNGDYDVYIAKLNENLTNLIASTYLGGTNSDEGLSIALDFERNVYVTGRTLSSDFPTTSSAYETIYKNGDIFISKINSDLTSLLASTYLGGSSSDYSRAIAIDVDGNVFLTGETASIDFPITTGIYGGGRMDVFITKINGSLTNILASTYLGGSGYDVGFSIAIDTNKNIYVAGSTFDESADFPITIDAYDTSYDSGGAFISKFDNDLSSSYPTVITEAITNIAPKSATLNGTVNANGLSTTVWFEYGSNRDSYDNVFLTEILNGWGNKSIGIDVKKLKSGVIYYYRAVAENNVGVTYGNEMSFTTPKGKIYGYVIDTKIGSVGFVRLRIEGVKTKISESIFSDADGFFEFSNLDADTYIITVKKSGYNISKKRIKLREGQEKEIDIKIKRIKS